MTSEWAKSSGEPSVDNRQKNIESEDAVCVNAIGDTVVGDNDERDIIGADCANAPVVENTSNEIRGNQDEILADLQSSESTASQEEDHFPESLTRLSGMRLSSVPSSRSAIVSSKASGENCHALNARHSNFTPPQAEHQFAKFLKLADNPEIINKFVTLDTEQKIFDYLSSVPAIQDFRPELFTAPKNDREAAVNRKKACDLLQDADYETALKYFNKCVMLANPGSETLSLAYLDRSAVFHRVGKLKKANIDIERATKLPNSHHVTQLLTSFQQRLKLLSEDPGKGRKCVSMRVDTTRPDQCIVEQNSTYWKSLKMTAASSEALEALPDPKEATDAKLQLKTTTVERTSEGGDASPSAPILDTIFPQEEHGKKAMKVTYPLKIEGAEHPLLPGCSDALEPVYDSDKGWSLKASREILPGQVLMTEKPAVKILLREFWETHCQHCLQVADTCVPCDTCTKVVYCSENCREEARTSFHKFECPMIMNLSENSLEEGCLVGLRLITNSGPGTLQMLNAKIQDMDIAAIRSAFPVGGSLDWQHHSLLAVYVLPSNAAQREMSVLYKAAINAVYMAKCLQQNKLFWEELTAECGDNTGARNEMLIHLMKLIFNLVLITASNTFPIHQYEFLDPVNLANMKLTTVGVGISPLCNIPKHSCDPNAIRLFVDQLQTVRSQKEIKSGEEVLLSYGMIYYGKDKEQRRAYLRETRHFYCECQPCVENWPTACKLGEMEPQMKCSKCSSKSLIHELELMQITCSSCGESLSEAVNALKESQGAANFLWSMIEQGSKSSVEFAIDVFIGLVKSTEQIYVQPNKHRAHALQQLSKLYAIQAGLHMQCDEN